VSGRHWKLQERCPKQQCRATNCNNNVQNVNCNLSQCNLHSNILFLLIYFNTLTHSFPCLPGCFLRKDTGIQTDYESSVTLHTSYISSQY
jgi:hypothetical protein